MMSRSSSADVLTSIEEDLLSQSHLVMAWVGRPTGTFVSARRTIMTRFFNRRRLICGLLAAASLFAVGACSSTQET